MRRISKRDCLNKNRSSASKYSFFTLLVALLLTLDPVATFAQTDPFKETKPATANPFADVSPSDEKSPMPTEPVTTDAASAPANPSNPFGDPPPAQSEPDPADASLTQEFLNAESLPAVTPKAAEDLPTPPAKPASVPKSTDWVSWLIENWYWPLAALIGLPLLAWLLLKGKKSKTDFGPPRIKKGTFKKSTRFQDGEASTTKPIGIASEAPSSEGVSEQIDIGESSDMFGFDDELESEISKNESSSIEDITNDLTGEATSIDESDDDDDFLDLMMDETEENETTKLADDSDEINDSFLEPSEVEVDPSAEGQALDDDDDDFLDLVMDETEETDTTNLADASEEVGALALDEDDVTVEQSVPNETLDDDDDFLEMMLDEDEASLQADEGAPVADATTESFDIEDPVESQDPIVLTDDSGEFDFDLEDDTPAAMEPMALVEDDITNAEEMALADVDETPTPPGGITFNGNDEVLINVDNGVEIEDIEQEDDQSSVAGGVAAAAGGILAGFGGLLAAKSSSDSDPPEEGAASGELRDQLAQALEKQQQNAAEINAQHTEIEALKAKLDGASDSSDELNRLKAELQELKDGQLTSSEANTKLQQDADELQQKLEEAERNASEFESKLEVAESSKDALEKEKQELAKELESKSDGSEAVEKLEAEIAALKSEAKETVNEKEQLQSEAEKLRQEVVELRKSNDEKVADSGVASGSLMATALSDDATDGNVSDDARFQQLKARFEDELALRKQTEEMLVEAEQQRTDVAIALRDLRKQLKGEGDSGGSSEELDALKEQLADSESVKEELSQQLDSFRKKLEQEHNVAKELTGKLNVAQEKVSAVTVNENEWTQRLEALESDLESKEKETTQLAVELQSAKDSLSEFEGKVAELQTKEEAHQSILADHEAALLESQSNLESAIAEKAQMETALVDLKDKAGTLSYGQLEEALANVARLGDERTDLTLKLEQTRTTGEEVARENAQLTERVSQLEKQLDSNSVVADQLAEARQQLDHAKQQAVEADQKNNALQLQVDSLKQNFESLDRQRLSLKENLEARDKEVADGALTANKETAKLIQKIAGLEQSLSSSDDADDIKLQLTEEKEQLRHAKEQNSVLTERIAGLEQQLMNRQAESEKLDSVEQRLVAQTELVVVAKEENATLKERVAQLNEQVQVARAQSAKLEQATDELSSQKARLSEMSLTNTANQQRMELLEDQIAKSKEASLNLTEATAKLAQASSERVALEQKCEGLLLQLEQVNAVADKNERLNKQVGALQRELEAAEKSNRALEYKLEEDASANNSGAVGSAQLERILGQLESQSQQISQLVEENRKMAVALASTKATSSKKSASSKTSKATKTTKAIPKGCDDLAEIAGIGPKSRDELYKAGVKKYRQIADWTKKDIATYSEKLGYKSDRIEREKWISQAKKLS